MIFKILLISCLNLNSCEIAVSNKTFLYEDCMTQGAQDVSTLDYLFPERKHTYLCLVAGEPA